MMKRLKIVTITIVLCICIPSNADVLVSDEAKMALETLVDSTVSFITEKPNGKFTSCTGIVIKNENDTTGILTAKHCTTNAVNIYLGDFPDEQLKIAGWKASKDADIAYLMFDGTINRKTISLAKRNPKLLEKVFTLGYPYEKTLFNYGRVVLFRKHHLVMNFEVIGGCSGSGIINKRHELVGILWGGANLKMGSYSIATSIKKIREFLKSIKVIEQTMFLIK